MRTRSFGRVAFFAFVELCLVEAVSASSGLSHKHPKVAIRQAPPAQKGCFSSPGGDASTEGAGYYTWQSSSHCTGACASMGKPVAAMIQGSTCYCADLLPAASDEVDQSQCSTPCTGYNVATCGGPDAFAVWLTGTNDAVGSVQGEGDSSVASSSSDGSDSTSQQQTSSVQTVVTHATNIVKATTIVNNQPTVVQTVEASPTSDGIVQSGSDNHSSTGSTVGIAIGVVVGILGFAALVIFIVFYLRRRRRMKNAENGHARADSLNAFVAGGSVHTIPAAVAQPNNDSRLDPRLMVERRRQSAGSVFADNEDYSRRILKVTNPEED